jgi:hypothetical protein
LEDQVGWSQAENLQEDPVPLLEGGKIQERVGLVHQEYLQG